MAADLPFWKRPLGLIGFLANQLWRLLPVAVLGFLLQHRLRDSSEHGLMSEGHPDRAATIRALYVAHAVGPFAMMTVLALVVGMELQMHWGTAFLWALAPLALLTSRGRRLASVPVHHLFAGFLLVQVLTLAYQAFLRAG
jgi:hypothetical protein